MFILINIQPLNTYQKVKDGHKKFLRLDILI